MHNSGRQARINGVALRLEDVRREFDGGKVVIDGLNLRVAAGEFLAILGPSGCGKSTLLRMIARLDRPNAGRLEAGHDGTEFQTAFVFQDAHLLPWRNVLGNTTLPLEFMKLEKAESQERARTALDDVGLLNVLDYYPAQLSGGMRMRVSLARALVTNPQLLLLDEPFAALDEITRFHLDEHLRQIWHTRGMTVVFVTHSISEAAFLANRAIVLGRQGGRVALDHTLELPLERTNELRGDARLAREMKILLDAIETGRD